MSCYPDPTHCSKIRKTLQFRTVSGAIKLHFPYNINIKYYLCQRGAILLPLSPTYAAAIPNTQHYFFYFLPNILSTMELLPDPWLLNNGKYPFYMLVGRQQCPKNKMYTYFSSRYPKRDLMIFLALFLEQIQIFVGGKNQNNVIMISPAL